MIFGKHINRYYGKYALMLLFGMAALLMVDYLQLVIPNMYQMTINGINQGYVDIDGVRMTFDMDFLLDRICLPMVGIILAMVAGRFLWRVCIFGAAIKVETDIRNEMFDHCKDLSRQYYQVNKVGNLMSLFTNDLDTVQECYGGGFFDVLRRRIPGCAGIRQDVEHGYPAHLPVDGTHAVPDGGGNDHRQIYDEKVGCASGSVLCPE